MGANNCTGHRPESTAAELVAGPEIIRKAGPLSLTAVFAPTLSALRGSLDEHGYPSLPEHWLVSDLSLGAWTGHQLALELLGQLGCPEKEWANAIGVATSWRGTVNERDKDADSLGELIDAESKGDTKVLAALTLARLVLAKVAILPPRLFLVFMPRFGMPWRRENLAFVEFLAQALDETQHRLVMVAGGDDLTATPEHWHVRFCHSQPREGQAGHSQPRAGRAFHSQPRAGQAGHSQPRAGQAGHSQPRAGQAGHSQPRAGQAGHSQPRAGQAFHSQPRAGRPCHLPAGLIGLIPGVIESDVARQLHAGDEWSFTLQHGKLLLSPDCRRKPDRDLRLAHDKLGVQPFLSDQLKAYAHLYDNNYYCDLSLLCSEAWQQLRGGSFDIAIDYMKRAVSCARTGEQRSKFVLDLQGMYIASQRFAEAAEVADPNENLPDKVKGAMAQTKGWALTMLGRADAAVTCLETARSLLAPHLQDNRRRLYLENIYALSRLKSGDTLGALHLEREIERELDRHTSEEGFRDWRLTYVNSINQARLYRVLGDDNESLRYYRRAFGTTLGMPSESDVIYANVCTGRLFKARGQKNEAFLSWLHAGLYWASSSAPEALAPRVRAAILRHRPVSDDALTEAIAATLYEELRAAAEAAGLTVALSPDLKAPVFRKTREVEGRPLASVSCAWTTGETPVPLLKSWRDDAMVIAGCGWSAIAAHTSFDAAYEGPENLALRRLLFSLLRALVPSVDWEPIQSVLIDDALGLGLPSTLPDLVSMAVRLEIEKILYDGTVVEVKSNSRKRMELALSAGLGPAVDRVNSIEGQTKVVFKRYRGPLSLSALESRFLALMAERPQLGELMAAFDGVAPETVLACARKLEKARVIRLELSDVDLLSEFPNLAFAALAPAETLALAGASANSAYVSPTETVVNSSASSANAWR